MGRSPLGPRLRWDPRRWHSTILTLLALTACAALARLPRLGVPPSEMFDEVYHARTALEYLQGRPPTEWVHPPLAKLLIAAGVALFGYKAWAWRLLPALAGIALAPLFYTMARRALASERAALLASVLLLSDGVYLVQSRIAMTNIFAVLFQTAAAWLVLEAAWSERWRWPVGIALGTALGLAWATRWTSLWATAFFALVLLAGRGRRLLRWRELLMTAVAFLVLPAALYFLAYVPWMAQGHSLAEVLRLQASIWHYHATLEASHPYFSAWYTWPWLVKPTWYYYQPSGGWAQGIIALGNPALWWASVPVTVWALLAAWRRHDGRLLFAGLGFCALYLPWALSPRRLNYCHYLFEAIPYACLSLGALLDRLWDGRMAKLAKLYVALAILLLLLYYPVLTAWRLPEAIFTGEGLRKLVAWLHLAA